MITLSALVGCIAAREAAKTPGVGSSASTSSGVASTQPPQGVSASTASQRSGPVVRSLDQVAPPAAAGSQSPRTAAGPLAVRFASSTYGNAGAGYVTRLVEHLMVVHFMRDSLVDFRPIGQWVAADSIGVTVRLDMQHIYETNEDLARWSILRNSDRSVLAGGTYVVSEPRSDVQRIADRLSRAVESAARRPLTEAK